MHCLRRLHPVFLLSSWQADAHTLGRENNDEWPTTVCSQSQGNISPCQTNAAHGRQTLCSGLLPDGKHRREKRNNGNFLQREQHPLALSVAALLRVDSLTSTGTHQEVVIVNQRSQSRNTEKKVTILQPTALNTQRVRAHTQRNVASASFRLLCRKRF